MQVKQQEEQWLDIDDLLADVQSMVQQPVLPPRVTTSSFNPPGRSLNSSSSSYSDVFDPLQPPRIPGRSLSPNFSQPPLPARTFSSFPSSPPVSPSRGAPLMPAAAPRPVLPPRTNVSNSGRSSPSEKSNNSADTYQGSAFKNFSHSNPNPHEESLRKRSSIEELNRRTEELSLQRNSVLLLIELTIFRFFKKYNTIVGIFLNILYTTIF